MSEDNRDGWELLRTCAECRTKTWQRKSDGCWNQEHATIERSSGVIECEKCKRWAAREHDRRLQKEQLAYEYEILDIILGRR